MKLKYTMYDSESRLDSLDATHHGMQHSLEQVVEVNNDELIEAWFGLLPLPSTSDPRRDTHSRADTYRGGRGKQQLSLQSATSSSLSWTQSATSVPTKRALWVLSNADEVWDSMPEEIQEGIRLRLLEEKIGEIIKVVNEIRGYQAIDPIDNKPSARYQ